MATLSINYDTDLTHRQAQDYTQTHTDGGRKIHI